MEREVHGHAVRGVDVGPETRCAHYDGGTDVIAIRHYCCGAFYPCHDCHEAVADHAATVWPQDEFDEGAILCGACGTVLTVTEYLDSAHSCPDCGADFNPGCARPRHLYFETDA